MLYPGCLSLAGLPFPLLLSMDCLPLNCSPSGNCPRTTSYHTNPTLTSWSLEAVTINRAGFKSDLLLPVGPTQWCNSCCRAPDGIDSARLQLRWCPSWLFPLTFPDSFTSSLWRVLPQQITCSQIPFSSSASRKPYLRNYLL